MKMLAFLVWIAFAVVISAWGFGTYVMPRLVAAYGVIYAAVIQALGG